MNTQNTHIRFGFAAVRPYLYGPIDLPQFVERTFAAVEVERHAFGPKSFHVAYKIGDSVVIIEAGDLSPEVSSGVGATYVYVEDVDAVYDRALKLGAKSVARPEDKPYRNGRQVFRMQAATPGGSRRTRDHSSRGKGTGSDGGFPQWASSNGHRAMGIEQWA
jgi:PhnB protein